MVVEGYSLYASPILAFPNKASVSLQTSGTGLLNCDYEPQEETSFLIFANFIKGTFGERELLNQSQNGMCICEIMNLCRVAL